MLSNQCLGSWITSILALSNAGLPADGRPSTAELHPDGAAAASSGPQQAGTGGRANNSCVADGGVGGEALAAGTTLRFWFQR